MNSWPTRWASVMREKTRAAQEGRAAGRGDLRASLAEPAGDDGVVRVGWGFPPAGAPLAGAPSAGPLHPEQAMASATRQAGRIRVRWRQVRMQR
jgi:hypothetical protein